MPPTRERQVKRRAIRHSAQWVVVACAIVVALVWALERWPGDAWWASALLAYAPQLPWLGPAIIALLSAAVARDRVSWALAGLLLPAVLFGLMGLHVALPGRAHAGQRLTVVTWNVHDEYQQARRVRSIVERLHPDVVFLQEAVHPAWRAAFRGWHSAGSGGQWIFSRREVEGVRNVNLNGGWRPARQSAARVGRQRVALLDVHMATADPSRSLTHPSGGRRAYLRRAALLRRRQICGIAAWAVKQPGPFIIAGDFNTPPNVGAWKPLRAAASDAFAARGLGFGYTFPRRPALWRIDCAWVSPGCRVLRAGTFDGGLSDHGGVRAEVQLPARGPQAPRRGNGPGRA
jgi:vancomycin resistance protein VanJ